MPDAAGMPICRDHGGDNSDILERLLRRLYAGCVLMLYPFQDKVDFDSSTNKMGQSDPVLQWKIL